MYLDTLSSRWKPTNPGGNYTNNGYPTRVPTTTLPAALALSTGIQAVGDGVIQLGAGGTESPIYLDLVPFGVDASTHTFSFQILGWSETTGTLGNIFGGSSNVQGNLPLWVPVWLGTYQATITTTLPGIAGSDIGSTQSFASAITCTAGPVYGTAPTQSPDGAYAGGAAILTGGTTGVAMVELMTRGFRFLEVIFTTGGVVTSCNALYRKR